MLLNTTAGEMVYMISVGIQGMEKYIFCYVAYEMRACIYLIQLKQHTNILFGSLHSESSSDTCKDIQ